MVGTQGGGGVAGAGDTGDGDGGGVDVGMTSPRVGASPMGQCLGPGDRCSPAVGAGGCVCPHPVPKPSWPTSGGVWHPLLAPSPCPTPPWEPVGMHVDEVRAVRCCMAGGAK